MENLLCTSRVDRINQTIVLSGINSLDFVIDYSGDIDFTPFVQKLSEIIDLEKMILFTHEDLSQNTEKENLVIATLEKIIASYNASIVPVSENDINVSEIPNIEGLPF